MTRPVYLQLCLYLGTEPGDRPGRWLDIPAGFATDQDARVTLAYPPAWNPDTFRQRHIDEVIRRHLGGDLAAAFDLPARKIHLASLVGGRKWIAVS